MSLRSLSCLKNRPAGLSFTILFKAEEVNNCATRPTRNSPQGLSCGALTKEHSADNLSRRFISIVHKTGRKNGKKTDSPGTSFL